MNSDYIMSKCIKDHGNFSNPNQEASAPTQDDYIFHLTFCMLEYCCINERIQNIIPRVILNNLAIKLIQNELNMCIPIHQEWAMHIFDKVRSDLVPDFISKLKLNNLVTEELLVSCA